MLRYKADRRTLAIVSAYFSILLLSWLVFDIANWWQIAILVILNCLFSFFCAVIVHNTIHVAVFKNRNLNRIFQMILSLTYGHPVSAFVPGHNLSHHKQLSTPKDIIRPSKVRYKINFFNYLFFFFHIANAVTKSEFDFLRRMRHKQPKWFHQYIKEFILVFGLKLTLLVIDPVKTIVLILIPHFYAVWGILSTNFWQHDGCDMTHEFNHSRNFKSSWLNFWTCNNGYHGMHHMKPDLHWSLLPQAHEQHLAPYIHPNLNRGSLVKFLWEATISPGKRVDYLGNPVVLPPSVPDEDWIADIEHKVGTSSNQFGAG